MKPSSHIAISLVMASVSLAAPDSYILKSDDNKTYGPFALTNGARIAIETRVYRVEIIDAISTSHSGTSARPDNVVSLSARELCNTYESNEVAGDTKYMALTDKIIRITGIVDTIEKTGKIRDGKVVKGYSIRLEPKVQCIVYDPTGLAAISSGQQITLEGTYKGYDSLNIINPFVVDECVIVNK